MSLPRMLLVKQDLPDRRLPDVTAAVQEQMAGFVIKNNIPKGASIAIAVGSRGINNLPDIVREVVSSFKAKGFRPFIVPAMGSHGGATAEGQKKVLATLGITERSMVCPIKSSMDVVSLGHTKDGIETVMDRNAYRSSGVFLINRVKWHTDFVGSIESGLAKMATVGLGKQIGAENYHRVAFSGAMSMGDVVQNASRHIFASGKVLGGLAVGEDSHNNTAIVRAILAKNILKDEAKLLETIKSWKADIPVHELDVLIVDQIGKNFSGPGMDPKVINRNSVTGATNYIHNGTTPWIGRIYIRSLDPRSLGNAMGIGMADIAHINVIHKMDLNTTVINATTAQIPKVASLPIHAASDRACLDKIITNLTADPKNVRIGWILNTMTLGEVWLSDNLITEIKKNTHLKVLKKENLFRFDTHGQLISRPFRSPKRTVENLKYS